MINVGEYIIRGSYGFYIIPYLFSLIHRKTHVASSSMGPRCIQFEVQRIGDEIHMWTILAWKNQKDMLHTLAGWWFQIFFMFNPTWGNGRIWPIFFRWVETTNCLGRYPSTCSPNITPYCPIQLPRVLSQNYPTFSLWQMAHCCFCWKAG